MAVQKYKKMKNTLTGPATCNETTRHHAHLPPCSKSRKTNDAKLRKMAKNLNLGNFLTILRSNIFKLQIFLKNRFQANWRPYLVLTSGEKPKKLLKKKKITSRIFLHFWMSLTLKLIKSKLPTPLLILESLYLTSWNFSWYDIKKNKILYIKLISKFIMAAQKCKQHCWPNFFTFFNVY